MTHTWTWQNKNRWVGLSLRPTHLHPACPKGCNKNINKYRLEKHSEESFFVWEFLKMCRYFCFKFRFFIWGLKLTKKFQIWEEKNDIFTPLKNYQSCVWTPKCNRLNLSLVDNLRKQSLQFWAGLEKVWHYFPYSSLFVIKDSRNNSCYVFVYVSKSAVETKYLNGYVEEI